MKRKSLNFHRFRVPPGGVQTPSNAVSVEFLREFNSRNRMTD